jgi:N6-L-threonylcarbamoyladenine synthase
MLILGIETSCDETAVAVIKVFKKNKSKTEEVKVLSNAISSQVRIHARYGGVVPNLAAREHTKNIEHVFKIALKEAKIKIKDIDLIAVTRGPGLGPSLLVGIAFARTLAWKYNKPLIGVNHLEGHIYSNWLPPLNVTFKTKPLISNQSFTFKIKNFKFPILNLIVSGGHTELVLMKDHGKYEIIGETLDDAVGEAFDKVARLLDLGYPGGPAISKEAEKGNPNSYLLPSPMLNSKNYNFSFAGLKTAVLYLIRDLINDCNIKTLSLEQKRNIAASFQKAALDVLVAKTIKAAQEYKSKSLFISGGVSANKELRKRLQEEAQKININYSLPALEYTGDNAAMIAMAGYFNYQNQKKIKFSWDLVKMDANLNFEPI